MKSIFPFYNFIGFWGLLKREIKRFMKVYIQSLIAPLLSNMLFLGVFGGMLQTRQVGIDGVDYLHFLVPGLASMGAIFASFQNPSFSIIVQKFGDTLKDLNSYPISNFEKTLAFVLGGTVRGFLIGILTYIATIPFIGYTINNPFIFFLILIIISFIFSSLGTIIGLIFDNFEKLNFILSIVLTPLAYFGGVFFEVSQLPGLLSKIVVINPLYPLINMVRYGYLGVHEGQIFIQFIFIILMTLGSFSIAYYLLNKGVGLRD